MHLRGIVCGEDRDQLYLLVVWSGISVKADKDGNIIERSRYCRPMRDIMVFGRAANEKTNQNNTLSSSHCPNCGGTLSSHFAMHCGYCGFSLNTGKEWQLKNLLKEIDPVYLDILQQKSNMVSDKYAKLDAQAAQKRQNENLTNTIRSGKDIVSVMALILMADGRIDESESRFITDIAKKYHMPNETLQGILTAAKEGHLEIPVPANHQEALETLKCAAEMAYADGELAPSEEQALIKIANKLGYSAPDLKRVLRNAQSTSLNNLSLKKHLNFLAK